MEAMRVLNYLVARFPFSCFFLAKLMLEECNPKDFHDLAYTIPSIYAGSITVLSFIFF
jgi:hypothetical protein